MPRQKWGEHEWARLVEQLRNGDCTPFLGSGACSGTLPTGVELGKSSAEEYQYPFDDAPNLAEVMQYASIVLEDPVTLKQRVARQLSEQGEPDYTDAAEPHALLAKLPVKVYLTTNYDDFMTRSLQRAGKRPVQVVCPWYRGAETDDETKFPPDYQPSIEEPLVYHLHGNWHHPASLVLAEQDYVEFLVTLARELGANAQQVVPVQILRALTRQPLLFIGYSLRDWSFRMLFHGFVKTVADVQQRRHVSVQLAPLSGADPARRTSAENYLTRYFERLNISVYWGSADRFCAELRHRLEAA